MTDEFIWINFENPECPEDAYVDGCYLITYKTLADDFVDEKEIAFYNLSLIDSSQYHSKSYGVIYFNSFHSFQHVKLIKVPSFFNFALAFCETKWHFSPIKI